MDTYTGPEHGPAEVYMIPGTSSNPHIAFVPMPEQIDYMGNEVAAEVVYDQGLYYPAANYYGYYCTGPEMPGEWDDHRRFFGLDGQELHYPGLQTESLPYVYYPPSYGYAQSSYNPYNPYIPGAVIGIDGPSFIGTPQYFANSAFEPPVSSAAAYIPVIVQPSSDFAPNSFGPSLFTASTPVSQASAGVRHSHLLASSDGGPTAQRAASRLPTSEPPHQAQTTTKSSECSAANALPSKHSSAPGTVAAGGVTQMMQDRYSSGSTQMTDCFSSDKISSIPIPNKVTAPSGSNFESNVREWVAADRFRPRYQYGVLNNGSGVSDILGEQNRGPRTSRSRGQWTTANSDGTRSTKADTSVAQGTIVIYADQYNRDDFAVDYPDAKFFVIKSYSEDDVHKSIKYNVWSSTPNGNKRLDCAYADAQRISAGKPGKCPIFLFFSVNASGQFCGVAEMTGSVDFQKDMDFWHQDKWTGSFPVKWHIIKDVPNTSFRHIILENNENKPVTNSRDTQEITHIPGMNMLNIFKSSPLKTSILDDFMFYEDRQRIMQEEKSRFLGRSFNVYVPAIVANKTSGSPSQNESSDEPQKEDMGQSSGTIDRPPKGGKEDIHLHSVAGGIQAESKSSGDEASRVEQVTGKSDGSKTLGDRKNVEPDPEGDGDVASSTEKLKSLSIDSKESDAKILGTTAIETCTHADVVTVGSMHIKVNGNGEPSSRVITIGEIPTQSNVSKLSKQGAMSDSLAPHK